MKKTQKLSLEETHKRIKSTLKLSEVRSFLLLTACADGRAGMSSRGEWEDIAWEMVHAIKDGNEGLRAVVQYVYRHLSGQCVCCGEKVESAPVSVN